jgi:hypothetical protein
LLVTDFGQFFCAYSLYCLEEVFSETHMQDRE